jgi:hypothetical protein
MARDKSPRSGLRIELNERGAEQAPALAVVAYDDAGEVLATAIADAEGSVDLDEGVLARARSVAVAPLREGGKEPDTTRAVRYHASEVAKTLKRGGALEISRRRWADWIGIRRCVEGRVRKCWFDYPYYLGKILNAEAAKLQAEPAAARTGDFKKLITTVEDARIARLDNIGIIRPWRPCQPVCHGVVDVYRRVCCCEPWVYEDSRLPELIRALEELIIPPVVKWPPQPGPDPDPNPIELGAAEPGGSLKELALEAGTHLQSIRSLSAAERFSYIQARPYLWCFWTCGPVKKVGTGFIQPDGDFRICWNGGLVPANCREYFAFVVRQVVNGVATVIYNGLASNQWFSSSSNITLTTYSKKAIGCVDPIPPVDADGNFILLQDITGGASWRLATPDQSAPFDCGTGINYNSGLFDPDPSGDPMVSRGKWTDRNFGGTLALRYYFSQGTRTMPNGAAYYRVSVAEAGPAGAATGPRTYYADPLAWLYYQVTPGDLFVVSETLGPQTVGGEANLYKVPHIAEPGRPWLSGQSHAYIDTTKFANKRYLITLEVFDATGKRICPNGGAKVNPADDFAPFTYRRWKTEPDTDPVPFGALTHLFWWDNRAAVAQIIDLRKNGDADSSECQFLEGTTGDQFSVGYRAYHPFLSGALEPRFIHSSRLWARRGLGGPVKDLDSQIDNAPATGGGGSVAVSPNQSFGYMLDLHPHCSFAVNLHVAVKTTNGGATLTHLNASDQAAFALSVS